MEFKFVPYHPQYFDAVVDLLNISFKMTSNNKRELIKWKLFNEVWDNPIIYLALHAEKVIGIYTSIPHPVAYQKQKILATSCIDMATHPHYRRLGIIKKLAQLTYEKVQEKNYAISFGFSNDSGVKVDQHADGYGYYVLGKFEKYYKPVVRYKSGNLALTKINKFSSSIMDPNYLQIQKDAAYLTWRYLHKPDMTYQIFEINQDGKNTGYVILKFGKRYCYVYDIIVNNHEKSVMHDVFNAIENTALEKGFRLVIYNVLKNKYWEDIFASFKYFIIPNPGGTTYYFTVKPHTPESKSYLNKEKWLLMAGDII